MSQPFQHISVLLDESIRGLNIRSDGVYIDGTAGAGGHSARMAALLTSGRLIAVDQDPDAIAAAQRRLAPFSTAQVVQANFTQIPDILADKQIVGADGILLDLGVSSFQLDTPERGFSYRYDGALDMRMSKEGETAGELVNTLSQGELTRLLFEYGEETYSRSVAAAIVRARTQEPIRTTSQLTDIVKSAMPPKARREKHPCKRVFQALRIAVNHELDNLSAGIDGAFSVLNPRGRLAVITFHSLEDRLVKQKFRSLCTGCTCPPDFPICICGHKPQAVNITRKPIVPSAEEIAENPRSKSAKLRIIEKKGEDNEKYKSGI